MKNPVTTDVRKKSNMSHKMDTLKCLIERGSNVNQRNEVGPAGFTPLFYCWDADSFTALCNAGASLEITNEKGENAALVLYKNRLTWVDIKEAYMDRGGDYTHRSFEGISFLHRAVGGKVGCPGSSRHLETEDDLDAVLWLLDKNLTLDLTTNEDDPRNICFSNLLYKRGWGRPDLWEKREVALNILKILLKSNAIKVETDVSSTDNFRPEIAVTCYNSAFRKMTSVFYPLLTLTLSACQMVYKAGFRINVVEKVVKQIEENGLQEFEKECASNHAFVKPEVLEALTKLPKMTDFISLKDQCRKAIRCYIGLTTETRVKDVQLPLQLVEFIRLSDIDDISLDVDLDIHAK